MSDSDPNRDTAGAGAGPDGGSSAGAPRWVKVSALVAVVVILVFIVMLLTGGGPPGGHGPGRHTGSGDAGARTPPADVGEGHQPPRGEREHDARP